MKYFNWKYRYFKKKLKGVHKMIADLEFKRYKTLEIREDIRQEYENARSKLAILEDQAKKEKEAPTMEEGEAKRLDDQKVLLERDISRFKDQIKQLDLEVSGSNPTAEYHDGVQGINQQLEALHELVGMLKDYIRKEI